MGRTVKQNADYFPHENSMRNDKKLKAVRAKFGLEGYAIYNMVIESLTESDLLRIEDSELEMEMLAGDFSIDVDHLNTMISYFIKIDLLQHKEKYLWCKQLDNRLKGIFDKRKVNLNDLRSRNGISDAETDIVKERKVKEREVKDITEKPRIHVLQDFVKENTQRVKNMKEQLTFEEAIRLSSEYPKEALKDYLAKMDNWKPLLKKNFNVNLTLRNWIGRDSVDKYAIPMITFGIKNGNKVRYRTETEELYVQYNAKYRLDTISDYRDIQVFDVQNKIEKCPKDVKDTIKKEMGAQHGNKSNT